MSKQIQDQQSIKIFKMTEHEAQFLKYSRENERQGADTERLPVTCMKSITSRDT